MNSVILYLFIAVLYDFSYNCLFFSVMLILAFEIIVILFTDFSALSGYL
ncbi:putative membrane protein [Citrobacter freundii]|nr:putative membrane protein [Citrobacter freundii]